VTFDQAEWEIRLEWGVEGVNRLAPISDVVIVVDVLSFSTGVDIAVSNGAVVFPYASRDCGLAEYARLKNAHPAETVRGQPGAFSLSPQSLLNVPSGYRLVLPSPNGAALCMAVGHATTLAGCLRNCRAVAQAAANRGRTVAVIAAGEQWPDGSLRPCLEDLLGAGAVLQNLSGRRSPEADAAVAAFEKMRPQVVDVLRSCGSGKELIERGFECDVSLASEYDVSSTVPVLVDSAFIGHEILKRGGQRDEDRKR